MTKRAKIPEAIETDVLTRSEAGAGGPGGKGGDIIIKGGDAE